MIEALRHGFGIRIGWIVIRLSSKTGFSTVDLKSTADAVQSMYSVSSGMAIDSPDCIRRLPG